MKMSKLNKIFIDDSIQKHRLNDLKILTTKSLNNLEIPIESKLNFELVDSHNEATIIIFLVNSRENIENLSDNYNYIFETNKPIIILERQDSAITWCRNLEKIKNLKAIFKNRIMREEKTQNSNELIFGKHNYFLQRNLVKSKELITTKRYDLGNTKYSDGLPKLTIDQIRKIKCVLWDIHSSPYKNDSYNENIEMNYFKEREINFNKSYDIFCINSFKDNNYVDDPRDFARKIVTSLSDKFKVFTNDPNNITYSESESKGVQSGCIDSKKYRKLFEKCKVCVACWGFGEWVHMDAYAMYSGVILVKPNTDHVLMYPDIYRSNETYIACKHDYSDLKEVLEEAVENYDKYIPMLKRNRQLLKSVNEQMICETFWKNVISF